LVLRDLDLIQAINERARAVVAFSIITAPGSPDYERVSQIEHLAPPAEKRFQAMEKLAAAGIPTGICCMPILPGLCDSPENLEAVIRSTAEHGGQFVLASSLTLADQQKDYFFNFLGKNYPEMIEQYQKLYPASSYAPAGYDWRSVALRVRELCQKYGIRDRQPRPIIPGDGRTTNRRVVERLAEELYTLELENATQRELWAYRKAAWAVEDMEQDIGRVYRVMGGKGLASIPDIGQGMAEKVEALIQELTQAHPELPGQPAEV
jgi:DNA repair photolyase